MKEKDIKTIANSVEQVWLCMNEAREWEIHFQVDYLERAQKLTSYYQDEAGNEKTRSWLDLAAAYKRLAELFPHVTTVTLFTRPGVRYESTRKIRRSN